MKRAWVAVLLLAHAPLSVAADVAVNPGPDPGGLGLLVDLPTPPEDRQPYPTVTPDELDAFFDALREGADASGIEVLRKELRVDVFRTFVRYVETTTLRARADGPAERVLGVPVESGTGFFPARMPLALSVRVDGEPVGLSSETRTTPVDRGFRVSDARRTVLAFRASLSADRTTRVETTVVHSYDAIDRDAPEDGGGEVWASFDVTPVAPLASRTPPTSIVVTARGGLVPRSLSATLSASRFSHFPSADGLPPTSTQDGVVRWELPAGVEAVALGLHYRVPARRDFRATPVWAAEAPPVVRFADRALRLTTRARDRRIPEPHDVAVATRYLALIRDLQVAARSTDAEERAAAHHVAWHLRRTLAPLVRDRERGPRAPLEEALRALTFGDAADAEVDCGLPVGPCDVALWVDAEGLRWAILYGARVRDERRLAGVAYAAATVLVTLCLMGFARRRRWPR